MSGLSVRTLLAAGLTATVVASCTNGGSGSDDPDPSSSPSTSASSVTTPSPSSTAPRPEPVGFEASNALETIDYLAEHIGPRHATSNDYARAADWIDGRLDNLGYDVSRMDVRAPAGNTWGVDVAAGNSPNVIADPPGFDPEQPHAVVGAHLDTVPVAPGAEDNGSGVALMLELARLASLDAPDVPVRFVAFGAEEPRGPGDDLHHFGSQTYVNQMSKAQRKGLRAMVALDRVGVRGPEVPLCTGGLGNTGTRQQLRRAADAAGVPTTVCSDNRASDHWSFEKTSLPAARLGSIPYAGYHSPRDTPDVISRNQLVRGGRIMWSWMQRL